MNMNNILSNQAPTEDEPAMELVLTFLAEYDEFEGALVQAGFTRPGRTPKSAQPDWERFARHVEGKFDPNASPELMGAVLTLLSDPDNPHLCRQRQRDTYSWEPSLPERNTVWLAELVQEIRNRLMCGIHFMEEPDCDTEDVVAALFVIESWSELDPKIEAVREFPQ